MNEIIYPVEHSEYEPDCWPCSMSLVRSCGSVCNACGCRWDMELFDEPNRQDEACDGCDCHTWTLVESRGRARAEDGLEAAWKDAGYQSSIEVWQVESR